MRAANNFADSLSQYSKHSDELGAGSEAMIAGGSTQLDKQNKVSAIYSQKKHGIDKMGKTQKKLPDLPMGHSEGSKGRNVGASSDSDENNNMKQLPAIKGGMQHTNSMHHNSQVSEAYSMKGSVAGHHAPNGSKKVQPQNSSFNQSKYMSNHSPSPS